MKKLFVSVPMKGRTNDAIKNSIDKMHQIAELMFGEKLELIDSYVKQSPPKDSREAVWYLGESIKKLSEADCFIGVRYTDVFKGCNREYDLAREYEIPICRVDIEECSFLTDAKEIQEQYWEGRFSIPVCFNKEK